MRGFAALTLVLLLFFLLVWNLASAQTPHPASPTPSPVLAPTLEPLTLPGAPGEWWKTGAQLVSRFGPWVAFGLLLAVGVLYFLWKVGEEVAREEAKGIAARVRTGARVAWYRVFRRLTPEEQAIVKEVCDTCERLELKGFVKENITIVSLESIYVPLTAQRGKGLGGPGEEMPLLRAAERTGEVPLGEVPLTDLISRHPHLVVVGEAGSGKTTFLKYVASTAAHACTGRRLAGDDWLPIPYPLPIYLPLHGLGVYLADQKPADRESPSPDLLRDYIAHHLRHLDLPEGWVAQRLKVGNCLLLLDGLDEVARFEDRRFVAELVTRFTTFYDHPRVVVTTRPQGYEGAAQLGGDFERRDINPLKWPEDIRTFVYRWNEEINRRAGGGTLSAQGRRKAHENAEDLMARLETASNVRELANNPLLLTVMAIVHYNIGTLPERRADLYDAATELLLGWDKRMGRTLAEPPPWLDALSASQRRLPLEELASDFQERRTLERPRPQVLSFLAEYFLTGRGSEAEEAARIRAEEYLTWVTDRTYVLQDIGGAIRFYRKPFQEYLAARKLARQPDLRERVRQILAEDWHDRWWDETLLLTVGHLISDDPQKANDLLLSVRQLPDPAEAPHYNATFIARALADVPEGLLGSVWEVKAGVVEHLTKAIAVVEPAFSPRARLEASLALGALGDRRPGVGVDPETGLPDILWVPVRRLSVAVQTGTDGEVPAGPFLMGSTDREVERWKEWTRQRVEDGTYKVEGWAQEQVLELLWAWLEAERGQHPVEVPPFLISRYPVTNTQYRCFVEAGGYDEPIWWGGEESPGWAWRQGKPRWEWQRTDRPDFRHDPRYNCLNQPVVGVTWYEAMAFCRWLTEQLQVASAGLRIWRSGQLETLKSKPDALSVRLPTEAEWEKAARGTDGRTWPWGNEWDAALANTAESDLGRPSPVGILPAGDGPYEVADTVGNVWEWTLSLWGPDWRHPAFGYPYRPGDGREDTSPGDDVLRVVRGGSWYNVRLDARCAYRHWYDPDSSARNIGFRLVSPVGSES